jgi:hypothetical protein
MALNVQIVDATQKTARTVFLLYRVQAVLVKIVVVGKVYSFMTSNKDSRLT